MTPITSLIKVAFDKLDHKTFDDDNLSFGVKYKKDNMKVWGVFKSLLVEITGGDDFK